MDEPLTVRRWTGPGASESVDLKEPIFRDDKVYTVCAKVAAALGVQPWDMYMWVEREVGEDVATFAASTVKSIMRGEEWVSLADAVALVRGFIARTEKPLPAAPGPARVDHRQLLDLLVEARPLTCLESLTVRFRREMVYRHIFPRDPFTSTPRDVVRDPLVLEEAVADILLDNAPVDGVLHVTTVADFASREPGLVELYFPAQLQSMLASNLALDPPPSAEANALYTQVLRNARPVRGYFKKIYLSVQPVGPAVSLRLEPIFHNFTLDTICPLIKYRGPAGILYKLDRSALRTVPEEILAMWTREQVKKVESVVFKVYYGDFFATVVLFPMLVYHVKFTFRTSQSFDVDYIGDKVLPHVNHVISRIRDMVSVLLVTTSINIPHLDLAMVNRHNTLELHTARAFTFRDKLPTVQRLKSRMLGLSSVFSDVVMMRPSHDTFVVRYRRSSNFTPVFDVRAYMLGALRKLPRNDVIQNAARMFGVTPDAAARLYEDVERNEDELTQLARYFDGNRITITRRSDFQLHVQVHGTKIERELADHVLAVVLAVVEDEGGLISRHAARVRRAARPNARAALDLEDLVPRDDFFGSVASDPATAAAAVALEEDESDEDDDGFINKAPQYTLTRLKNADPGLFAYDAPGYKSYAALCASNVKRQPVVVTAEQRAEIDRRYPGAYTNAVHAGSTPELRERNIYICPQVWCTHSEVAMTDAQFQAQGCPSKEDVPLRMHTGRKYVSFLDPSRHPKEMCVPCCFLKDHGKDADAGRMRKRHGKCAGDALSPEEGGDGYVREYSAYPVGPGRFGRLPHAVASAVGDERFVRQGISLGASPYLACVAHLLGAEEGLIERADAALEPHHVIPVHGGRLARRLLGPSPGPALDPVEYAAFREWFLRLREYPTAFSLEGLRKQVARAATGLPPQSALAAVAREMMLHGVVVNLVNFLRSDAPKHHDELGGLFTARCLNPEGVAVFVLEEGGGGEVLVTGHGDPSASPISLILRHGAFYEPVCAREADGRVTTRFSLQDLPKPLRRAVEAAARESAEADGGLTLQRAAAALGGTQVAQVVNVNLRVVGLLSRPTGLFVPLPGGDAAARPDMPSIHAADLVRHVRPVNPTAALARLRDTVDPDFYDAVRSKDGRAVLLDDGGTRLPLDPAEFEEDLRVFTGVSAEAGDDALEHVRRWEQLQSAFQGFVRRVAINIVRDSAARLEFEFLRDVRNPFSRGYRLERMRQLVQRVAADRAPDRFQISKAADALLSRDLGLVTTVGAAAPRDVAVVSQEDIDRGALRDLLQNF